MRPEKQTGESRSLFGFGSSSPKKIVDITRALIKLLAGSDPELEILEEFLKCCRDGGPFTPPEKRRKESAEQHRNWMQALLTWGLAPGGFVAIGQTPALYDDGGALSTMQEAVVKHGGATNASLWIPSMKEHSAQAVIETICGKVGWCVAGKDNDIYVGFSLGEDDTTTSWQCMPDKAELLHRICGPFRGKETFVPRGFVRPPRHPCRLNWYMPRRDGYGMLEVRVNWKSQAETLLHVPQYGDRKARSRPKRILIASGGEYQSGGGRRGVMLRGSTVLPTGDGGRAAMLWLLSAGVPREGDFVALAAPQYFHHQPPSREYEVRALRLWERTFWLKPDEYITSGDLKVVNTFRHNFLEMQRRRPHRLAGLWANDDGDTEEYLIESLAPPSRPTGSATATKVEILEVSTRYGSTPVGTLRGQHGSTRWYFTPWDASATTGFQTTPAGEELSADEFEGDLRFSNGGLWLRHDKLGTDGSPLLGQICETSLKNVRDAAKTLFNNTAEAMQSRSDDHNDVAKRPQWPGRLVPFKVMPQHGHGTPHMAPFDVFKVEDYLTNFAAKLTPDDLEGVSERNDGEDQDDVCSESDDANFDVSQQRVDENYMWNLAEETDWKPVISRSLCFVESAIALPKVATCSECEEEGKVFSKSQLAKHPDDRKCKDCVGKNQNTVYRPLTNNGQAPVVPPNGASSGMRVSNLPTHATARTSNASVCSMCNAILSKENCSTSQRSKAPSKRKCNNCVAAAGAAAK